MLGRCATIIGFRREGINGQSAGSPGPEGPVVHHHRAVNHRLVPE